MSSTDYPHAATVAAHAGPAQDGPRRLTDGVMQSAEEAVLTEGLPETTPATGEFSVGKGDEPRVANTAGEAVAKRPLADSLNALTDFVARRPCTAALLAAGAGALTMMLLGKQVRRTRVALPWQRQRATR